MSIPLANAEEIARKIVAELDPFCERIEIAGLIRHGRPNVNKIDLVLIPKPGRETALRERCERSAIAVQTDGPVTLVVTLEYPPGGRTGLQLDTWLAFAGRQHWRRARWRIHGMGSQMKPFWVTVIAVVVSLAVLCVVWTILAARQLLQ